ncbi:MAG TPA: tRNA (cytidine(34)-2'-O)-methyltransferase [Candidatus Didemnitutus sp.]|nr:tRNA (cytidine(34)-2'-O)-methyltransferase [Candidatus Didemnitutus sp.]
MLHIVLLFPQIAPNTGNIGRMCAVTKSRLHLIHPLGFEITDAKLKRAGMDYWHSLDVHHHQSWSDFCKSPSAPSRLWLFTTHATRTFWDVQYASEDGLVFGNEGEGAPDWIHREIGDERRLKIPHANGELRSLNLSTAAGIACYEALRQIGMPSK